MVPFFGDSAKQNIYEYANQSILENHTGNLNYNIKYMFMLLINTQNNIIF